MLYPKLPSEVDGVEGIIARRRGLVPLGCGCDIIPVLLSRSPPAGRGVPLVDFQRRGNACARMRFYLEYENSRGLPLCPF